MVDRHSQSLDDFFAPDFFALFFCHSQSVIAGPMTNVHFLNADNRAQLPCRVVAQMAALCGTPSGF
jgi:hypothetical protein